jgi:hypothetical protein
MFTTDHKLFTQIMLKHFDRYEKIALVDPEQTKIVIYVFNQTRYKDKYDIMKYYIYNSKFVQPTVSVDMQFLFCYAQKTYYALSLFARLWKIKHSFSSITSDLMLTPLKDYNQKCIITLYEDGKPYSFYLPDIYNIIVEALTHCSHDYFLEIKPIKNPYTNLPFKLHNLYNIYIAYKNNTYTMPILFRGLIECDCDVKSFMHRYEPIIRDICIDKYFAHINNYKCIKEIRRMLTGELVQNISSVRSLKIDERFPWKNLIYHFKPFAKLYHKVKYTLNPYSKCSNKTLFIKKLKLFMYENPLYGRKFIYSTHKTNSLFLFGDSDRNSFNTTVKTHFKDMTNDKIKGISSYIRNGRYTVARHVHPIESDSDDESENQSGDEIS